MPNTTNFNFPTPADTDLVKDGAAAIRSLGNSIDTAFVDLKGGTTGQVLSKASNTDLDFSWVAQDDSNAIQNALLTTTGDTIYASATSTPARLGIGSTGQVLTVAGGVPTWAAPAAGGKVLQVVSATTTTQTVLATTTSTDTGITATITPTSATSKILIIMSIAVKYDMASANDLQARGKVFRGATTIADYGNEFYSGKQNTSGGFMRADSNHFSYLDNPTTTSATTYKLQSSVNDTSSSRQVVYQPNSAPSTITLLEIGA